ncbi:UDP-Glc:alpha-D-GlcNAc-diphosphoundecaprenol beta-1,3-glucosyltransferase WfgD [Streptococcus constellatus]|uniref:UDP-Glc:alpha-D-GlcNAc-diphosphoundecaprenol beta-1,3-glucosyltransferase WfgD n=1 Tax=Streptococcus constellatus TaxID=76860 RepID=A0A564SEE1_STRCV|nr:glycosyltransferase [Streptococcus constellatus]VUW93527.1 UDP-Glc:alpha-D-GlcNAc-diphosphoundecaprenol beta-1,3-glucosyltransferase WfgD [Streptococcus constellatus]VUX13391.1 UDP-Glc:alpha-D-GlcNAc-diphosphoundecaprenol beta-1,3-glucosyltransferase WfgD [Streptococcus gordonii]
MTTVLVMMSTYNGEKFLQEQVDSILNQEDCEVRLLIRDDGSKDRTIKILEDYSNKDSRVSWYTGENLRSAKSFMHLLIHCEKFYDYYAFADQDDVWDVDKLSVAIESLEQQGGPAIYCSNSMLVNEELEGSGEYLYKHVPQFTLSRVLIAGQIQGATMVLNRTFANYFEHEEIPNYIPMHDYYVSAVCLAVGGKVFYDSDSHMKYRQHGNNVFGIDTSFLGKVKRNLNTVFQTNDFFDLQRFSQELINLNRASLDDDSKILLNLAKDYKKSFINRLKLAFYKGLSFGRLNQAISFRLAILLGRL